MMKKTAIWIMAAAVLAMSLHGEDPSPAGPVREYGDVSQPEAEMDAFLREEGGYLDEIPAGPAVIVVDFRPEPEDGAAARVAAVVRGMYKMAATNLSAKAEGGVFANAVALRKSAKALMVLALSDEGGAPALAVYPEDRVAVVGAKAAVQYVKRPKDAETRLVKELWRGFGFIAGAGYAQNAASVMQPVGSPLELDAVSWQVVHPMALAQMSRFLKAFGAKQGRRTTYREACEEGWAPPPTNDLQKAVWEAAKARAATNAPAAK